MDSLLNLTPEQLSALSENKLRIIMDVLIEENYRSDLGFMKKFIAESDPADLARFKELLYKYDQVKFYIKFEAVEFGDKLYIGNMVLYEEEEIAEKISINPELACCKPDVVNIFGNTYFSSNALVDFMTKSVRFLDPDLLKALKQFNLMKEI